MCEVRVEVGRAERGFLGGGGGIQVYVPSEPGVFAVLDVHSGSTYGQRSKFRRWRLLFGEEGMQGVRGGAS